MTTNGDRPLDDCLATFWHGAFALQTASDDEPAAPALTDLGPSGITAAGHDLATLLAAAYRGLTGG